MEYLKLSVGLILGYELQGARLKGQVLQMVRQRCINFSLSCLLVTMDVVTYEETSNLSQYYISSEVKNHSVFCFVLFCSRFYFGLTTLPIQPKKTAQK